MSERDHQVALFCWARLRASIKPELRLLHAVPNGGKRDKVTAAKLKAEGVTAGVPDICLPVPCGAHHGLYIELKNDSPRGTVSPEQRAWLDLLAKHGYRAVVAYGWDAARAEIEGYLEGQK